MKIKILLLVLILDVLHGQTITRGPYLQMATETSITIRWRTSSSIIGRVFYGTSLNNLVFQADGRGEGTEHEVKLSGLSPGTLYYYNIGSPTGVLAGGDSSHRFYTSPAADSGGTSRIWILGDAGTGYAGQYAVRNAYQLFATNRSTDLVLLLGDNAYPNGSDAEYQANFFNVYPDILKQTPVWPSIGNHDTADSSNPNANYPYFQMFTLPTNAEAGGFASNKEHYYSFDRGNIHFICLDSMTSDRSANGPMGQWLQADLAACTKKWIVAFWHHPPYSKGSHDSDMEQAMIQMRTGMLPILEAGGVDLILCGHSHSYERSCLLDGHYGTSGALTAAMKKDPGNGRENGTGAYLKSPGGNRGAVHVVTGSAGAVHSGVLSHPAMVANSLTMGSVVIDIYGSRLDAFYVQPTGTPSGSSFFIADSFTILKEATIDSDKDGMPDEYEQGLALNPEDPSDAALDRDGDGITNIEEYEVSPVAPNGGSHRVLMKRIEGNTASRLVFHKAAGFKYRVLSSDDLSEWSPTSEWIPGNDKPHAWTDAAMSAPEGGKRMFRIEITPASP